MADLDDLGGRVERVLAELRSEYLEPHSTPWVIGSSWGKDSTLLVQLVMDMLLDLPRSQRRRHIHVVSNDTGVESPLVSTHVRQQQERLRDGVEGLDVPVSVHLTQPDPEQTFWANLIGRGYPPPEPARRAAGVSGVPPAGARQGLGARVWHGEPALWLLDLHGGGEGSEHGRVGRGRV